MKPEAQWFLVEALSRARSRSGIPDSYETKQLQLSHFGGVLAAFRYLDAITQEEQQDWRRRMLVALGYEPPEPATPGVSRAIYVRDAAKRPPAPEPPPSPLFVRSQPGPDEDFEVYGGRFRVISVEFYDSAVVFRWRASPEPDVVSALPDEVAALERDLVGLEDWAAKDLRWKGYASLKMRLYQFGQFGLTDDLGTPYIQMGLRHGSGSYGTSGEVEFKAPSSESSLLTLSWLGLEVPVPIA
jgi:hypothetical protein